MDIGQKLAQLEKRLEKIERSPRLTHASLDDTALSVYDGTGGLRGILGVQGDGTTAVNIVNGPPPSQPSAPIVASVLGGVTVSWDGHFADGSALPLDWARVEVHTSPLASYEPAPATLRGTIETAQGATVVVPCATSVYVRLLARNTSGTASTASSIVGPFGPAPVVADGIQDGIVTTVKLADDAVTAAKVAVGAIGSDELALGIGNMVPDPSFEGAYTAALITGHPDWTQVTPGNNSAKALHVDCTSGSVAWKNIELARYPVLPGERHYLAVDYKTSATFNGTGVKLMFRYEDAAAVVLGYGVADHAFTPGAPWARATAQVQAPAGTKTAVLLAEASSVTAGEAWFDNAEVRTLVAGGMVAAGTITATEIAALSILAGNLAADSVAAGKIAADAVTAREIAALSVTASEIAANTIVAGNLAAGSVDATALSATAITGKTITGGTITGTTITGGVLQTAGSGQRITLNEGGVNKVLVYNAAGTAIGELSSLGLLVKGTNGSILWLDPNSAWPNLRLTNAAQTNSAIINVSENTAGAADLGLNSGTFTGSSFSDMKWRTFFGNDFWVAERVRESAGTTAIGGRITLSSTVATIGYKNSTDSTQDNTFSMGIGIAQVSGGRLEVLPPASANTGIYLNTGAGHTGSLMRLLMGGSEKFAVDKDGNLTVAGIGQRTTKRRTTDATPKASTTTVTADTQIAFTVDANAVYTIEGFIKYSGPGDLQMGWSIPSGSLGEWHGIGNGTTVASSNASHTFQEDVVTSWGYTLRTESTDIAATRTYGGVGSTAFGVQVRGILRVGGTGGTFALTWAQGSSNATGTILYTDSYVQLEKVA